MKLLICMPVVFFLLTACTENQSADRRAVRTTPAVEGVRDLSAMALPEMLRTKYKSAKLVCNMWTRMQGPLKLSDTPNDSVSIDLLTDLAFPKVITLKATSEIHALEVKINLSDIKIQDGGQSDNYGARYTFKNSPQITGVYSGNFVTNYPEGDVRGQFSTNSFIVEENISSPIISSSLGPVAGYTSPTVNYAECTIVTQANLVYQDEWTQESAGIKRPCLLGEATDPGGCLIRRGL